MLQVKKFDKTFYTSHNLVDYCLTLRSTECHHFVFLCNERFLIEFRCLKFGHRAIECGAKRAKIPKNLNKESNTTVHVGNGKICTKFQRLGNLPFDVTEKDLREFFSPCGNIAEVRITLDRETFKPRG